MGTDRLKSVPLSSEGELVLSTLDGLGAALKIESIGC
jgi:hypothetical protein